MADDQSTTCRDEPGYWDRVNLARTLEGSRRYQEVVYEDYKTKTISHAKEFPGQIDTRYMELADMAARALAVERMLRLWVSELHVLSRDVESGEER